MRILLIDQTFYPVKIINWQRAIVLFVTGRAEVVEEYDDVLIRSVSTSIKLPKVLRLNGHFKGRYRVKFSRYNVFWRDNHTCQYCRKKFSLNKLTLDHVVPRSRGGNTSWENVVAACQKCNSKKSDKTLSEVNFKLTKKPRQPKWTPQLALKLTEKDCGTWSQWLNWGESKVVS